MLPTVALGLAVTTFVPFERRIPSTFMRAPPRLSGPASCYRMAFRRKPGPGGAQ
jgi:hypothetical protein